MITVADYLMGRDALYPLAMTPALRANAVRTVELVNKLLVLANVAGVPMPVNPATGTVVASGWRPPAVNAATAGASKTSMHMTCEACDLYDPAGRIDAWLMTADGQRVLTDLGLWLEHPDATPKWSHVQVRPPRSGNRVFRP